MPPRARRSTAALSLVSTLTLGVLAVALAASPARADGTTWTPLGLGTTTVPVVVAGTPATVGVTVAYGPWASSGDADYAWFTTSVSDADTSGRIRWTFGGPVTKLRLIGESNAIPDPGDHITWMTSAGPLDSTRLAEVGPGVTGHGGATWSGGAMTCLGTAQCDGSVVATFPAGITWIEAQPGRGAWYLDVALPNAMNLPLRNGPIAFDGASVTATAARTYTPATATSFGDGGLTYAVDDPGTTGCALVSPTSPAFTYTAPGTCVLRASTPETDTYWAATETAAFDIAPLPRTVALGDMTIHVADGSRIVLASVSDGSDPITYTVAAPGTAGCAVDSAGTLTWTGLGTCRVTAAVDASGIYAAASRTVDVTVERAPQTVTLSGTGLSAGAASVSIGDLPATPVTASTDGTGAITYAVADAGGTGCTVDPTTGEVDATAAGTCRLTATAAQTATHAAGTASADLRIAPLPRAVTASGGTVPVTAAGWRASAVVTAGPGTVTYAVADAGTTGCTVDPTTGAVAWTAPGTCRVTASVAATGRYAAASTTVDLVLQAATVPPTPAGRSLARTGADPAHWFVAALALAALGLLLRLGATRLGARR